MKPLTLNRIAVAGVPIVLALVLSGCPNNLSLRQVNAVVGSENIQVAVAISDRDRQVISRYYANRSSYSTKPGKRWKKKKNKRMPPGLAKRSRLPPGLAKKARLPAGLIRLPLPADLERKLQPVPRGYLRVQVGGSIVLMNQNTEMVLDLIYDLDGN